jgi:hypothetical protein
MTSCDTRIFLQPTLVVAMAKPPSSMRLFAFPLTSSRDLSIRRSGIHHPLIYYYAQMPKTKGTEDREPSLLKRTQDRASQMWNNWGNAPGGWKVIIKLRGASFQAAAMRHTADVISV